MRVPEVRAPPATPADTDDPVLGRAGRVNGHETTGVVAFTFDDGPNPATTPAVLDALERYDVPATFFIVTRRLSGKQGALGRAVLARELADGFLIGDHSADHRNLGKATGATLVDEIDRSVHELARDASRPVAMFRPPYGALSGAARAHLRRLGLTEVVWSIDTRDWRAHDPQALRRKVLRDILHKHGGIVLMHDIKPITAHALAGVLDDLESENCRRLATGRTPIVPVSIHYFLRDGRLPRTIPDAVRRRTAAYEAALPARCARRSQTAAGATSAPPWAP